MSVEFEMEGLKKRLDTMRKNITNPNPMMQKISLLMYRDQMDHFAKEESDTGAWAPIQYRKRGKAKNARILQDTGRLKNSIKASNTKDQAMVGTNVIYGPTHQYGSKNIPQRKFLYISNPMKEVFTKMLGKFFIGDD